MKAYNVDLGSALGKNSYLKKIPLVSSQKGPFKPNMVTINKDSNGRVYNYYENPITLNIDNHKFENVLDYSVIDYQDGVTDKGRLYNLRTPKSGLSVYTHDGKFARAAEYFNDKQTMNINHKPVEGFLNKITYKDGSQRLEMITKNYSRKIVNLDVNGNVIKPSKKSTISIFDKIAEGIKKVGKMLNSPSKLAIIKKINK